MPECFLGLDAGSSVTKAALFDAEGRPLAVADRRSGSHLGRQPHDPGRLVGHHRPVSGGLGAAARRLDPGDPAVVALFALIGRWFVAGLTEGAVK